MSRTLAIGLLFSVLYVQGCGTARAESEIVLQTIAMEAANQPEAGQIAVASVILNRARNAGTTLEHQVSRYKQFSCWNNPAWSKAWLAKHYTSSVRQSSINALTSAYKRNYLITHYHAKSIRPYWAKHMKLVMEIGNHLFYKET